MNPFDIYTDEEFMNMDPEATFKGDTDVSGFGVIGREATMESLLLKEERVSMQTIVNVLRRHDPPKHEVK